MCCLMSLKIGLFRSSLGIIKMVRFLTFILKKSIRVYFRVDRALSRSRRKVPETGRVV